MSKRRFKDQIVVLLDHSMFGRGPLGIILSALESR